MIARLSTALKNGARLNKPYHYEVGNNRDGVIDYTLMVSSRQKKAKGVLYTIEDVFRRDGKSKIPSGTCSKNLFQFNLQDFFS